MSMYQLALSKIVVGPAGQPSPLLELLDPVERSCYALIGALSVAITAEQVLPKDALLTLAVQVRTALETLDLTTYGVDLLNRAHVKNSESKITGTGRPRAPRIKYVVDFQSTSKYFISFLLCIRMCRRVDYGDRSHFLEPFNFIFIRFSLLTFPSYHFFSPQVSIVPAP